MPKAVMHLLDGKVGGNCQWVSKRGGGVAGWAEGQVGMQAGVCRFSSLLPAARCRRCLDSWLSQNPFLWLTAGTRQTLTLPPALALDQLSKCPTQCAGGSGTVTCHVACPPPGYLLGRDQRLLPHED